MTSFDRGRGGGHAPLGSSPRRMCHVPWPDVSGTGKCISGCVIYRLIWPSFKTIRRGGGGRGGRGGGRGLPLGSSAKISQINLCRFR